MAPDICGSRDAEDHPALKQTVAARVAAIADRGPIEIWQDDTFFVCQRGRVKLRTLSPTEGQLIFYQRANEPGPKAAQLIEGAYVDLLARQRA